jgi:uncharacterized protein YciI
MFIVTLTYTAPLTEIDRHMPAHVKFLQKHYKNNVFLVSGRQLPRTGGIILAIAKSRNEIEAIMAEDPFCQQGVAQFAVTEFLASQCHPRLKTILASWA